MEKDAGWRQGIRMKGSLVETWLHLLILVHRNSTQTEMAPDTTTPTLFDWAGGMPAFEKLTALFYPKVLRDPLLEPVFKHMSAEHQLHVAHFLAEVLGGPEWYSTSEGSHFKMIRKHLSRHLTE